VPGFIIEAYWRRFLMDNNTANTHSVPFFGEDFWNCAHNISHSKARKLVGRFGFMENDVPDIEQELLLALVKKLPHFDPRIARETTFIMRVVESKIADIIAHRQAGCRDWRQRGLSLNIPVVKSGVGVSDLVETLASENSSDLYLSLDIAEFIEQLPPELAELCELLKHYSVTEILDDNLITHDAFYHNLQILKEIFLQNLSDGKFP
jgi:RNA polymerase sigma-70 factor (ECF subfamily)